MFHKILSYFYRLPPTPRPCSLTDNKREHSGTEKKPRQKGNDGSQSQGSHLKPHLVFSEASFSMDLIHLSAGGKPQCVPDKRLLVEGFARCCGLIPVSPYLLKNAANLIIWKQREQDSP